MKRIIAILVVAMLMVSGLALAEKVTVSVWLDTDAIDVEMELYRSPLGFSMAYDPAHFALEMDETDVMDGTDVLKFTDFEGAFVAFQSVTGMTAEDLQAGLVLQSGTDECVATDVALGGAFAEPIESLTVYYDADVDGVAYTHSFYLVARARDVLQIETYYPIALGEEVTPIFSAMMETFELTTPDATVTSEYPSEDNMVQCDICGGWYKQGNEFRNHLCVAPSYPSEDNMVQCDICGGWYKEGNEFRNHVCVAPSYPSEDNTVQTYPDEDNIGQTYPDEDNASEW